MSSDHQHSHPPITTVELHRQPPPSTQSPTTPTPVSTLAAAFGRAISTIPLTSFQDAAINTNLRKLSDAASSINPTPTTTTPPKVPRSNPLRRTLSDPITINDQQTHQVTKNITPLRRSLSDTNDFIINPPNKTPRVSSSPQSSTEKQSKQFENLRRIEDMVREVEQRCWEIMKEEEQVEEDVKTNCSLTQAQSKGQEECVGVERMKNGDLRFELSCSCGKKFEMLIKSNGYCFYRLT